MPIQEAPIKEFLNQVEQLAIEAHEELQESYYDEVNTARLIARHNVLNTIADKLGNVVSNHTSLPDPTKENLWIQFQSTGVSREVFDTLYEKAR